MIYKEVHTSRVGMITSAVVNRSGFASLFWMSIIMQSCTLLSWIPYSFSWKHLHPVAAGYLNRLVAWEPSSISWKLSSPLIRTGQNQVDNYHFADSAQFLLNKVFIYFSGIAFCCSAIWPVLPVPALHCGCRIFGLVYMECAAGVNNPSPQVLFWPPRTCEISSMNHNAPRRALKEVGWEQSYRYLPSVARWRHHVHHLLVVCPFLVTCNAFERDVRLSSRRSFADRLVLVGASG